MRIIGEEASPFRRDTSWPGKLLAVFINLILCWLPLLLTFFRVMFVLQPVLFAQARVSWLQMRDWWTELPDHLKDRVRAMGFGDFMSIVAFHTDRALIVLFPRDGGMRRTLSISRPGK